MHAYPISPNSGIQSAPEQYDDHVTSSLSDTQLLVRSLNGPTFLPFSLKCAVIVTEPLLPLSYASLQYMQSSNSGLVELRTLCLLSEEN